MNSNGMEGQSSGSKSESDDGTKGRITHEPNLSSGMASKRDAMDVDRDTEQKRKKNLRKGGQMLEGSI